MRLEKILYERLVNNRLTGRQRNLTRPQKVFLDDQHLLSMFPSFRVGKVFDSLWVYILSRDWIFTKSRLDQAGLAFEDTYLYTEDDFRRNPFFEHIVRESTHPYQTLLFLWRRQRYFKVDMALKGFEAPQYIKEEARQRTFFDSFVNIYRWKHFVAHNYEGEITPVTYMYNGTRVILELFMIYGLTSRLAWSRYFFNEERYYGYQHMLEDFKALNRGTKHTLDFSNPEDLKEFERRANAWNKKFPGWFAPEGEEVNMKKIVATLDSIREEFKFNRLTSDDIQLIGINAQLEKIPFNASQYEGEEAKGSNNIGTRIPAFIEKADKGSILSAK